MAKNIFLAIDLGAESGRAVIGILDDKKLELKEIHRFPTKMISMNDHFYWNIYRFYEEIINGLQKCTSKENLIPESIGIDTWGVDFGIINKDHTLNRIPYAYRDPQSAKAKDDFLANKMTPEKIYQLTGISIQPFNSVYHLYSLIKNKDRVLDNAHKLLFIPDLLNFFLSGELKTEFSFATTTQLYNPNKGNWDKEVLETLNIDMELMPAILKPGSKMGMLKEEIARDLGIKSIPVVSVCSHDTGSAIVAVPAEGNDWAYISSGTWSLMGIEIEKPIISDLSFKYNFTNEGGAEGTFRFLKNIMGLWLLQQCRNSWIKTGYNASYSELVESAESAHPFKIYIDVDYEGFYNPEDMPSAIDEYCKLTGQESPSTVGEYTRTIIEGLAFKYRRVLEQLKETSSRKIRKIHIIGGGTQNKMLCQFTSNITDLQVIAGPSEGTAAGNLLMQGRAAGVFESLEEMREVVRNSIELERYKPKDVKEWEEAYQNYTDITNRLQKS